VAGDHWPAQPLLEGLVVVLAAGHQQLVRALVLRRAEKLLGVLGQHDQLVELLLGQLELPRQQHQQHVAEAVLLEVHFLL
jgi:hypothetical protein